MDVPKLESDLGIEVYASRSHGISGKIRSLPEDFTVQEILTDRSIASLQPDDSQVSGWGRYLLCILVKRNCDTLIATRKISELLDIDPDRIHTAGMKDSKALTAQHMTFSGVPPERISAIGIRNVTVRPLRFVDSRLSPRLLFGNRFNITIRALEHGKAAVERQIEKIRDDLVSLGGLLNYFGHQRFGTTRPITHIVGYHILRRDFEKAALTYLSRASEFEHPDAKEVREHLSETLDFRAALKHLPKRLIYERLMLKHLAKYPRDYLGAVQTLPPRLQKLFVQAYQSFLFNRFLSERVRRGLPLDEPQVGDQVVDLNELGLPAETSHMTTTENLFEIKQDVDERKASVAMPLLGSRQPTSEGAQGRIERDILDKEHITPSDFHIPQIPEANSQGGLRPVLTPILDLGFKEACDDQLNLDKLMVEVGFTLHKGSYATILLREFMKPQNIIEAGF